MKSYSDEEYVEVFPGAVCKKETFDKIVKECQKRPSLIQEILNAIDEVYRRNVKDKIKEN